MKLNTSPEPSLDSRFVLNRRAFLGGGAALAFLGAAPALSQTTNEAVQAAIAEVLNSSLPPGSNLENHALAHPEVRPLLENTIAYYRNREASDQTPPRSSTQFNQILQRLNATIRSPENSQILEAFPQAKTSLLRRLSAGKYGLFIDGEARQLFVVKRKDDQLSPLWQMDVTISRNGFSNQMNSNGSPYGEMWVSSVMEGRIGEVLLHNNNAHYRTGDLVNNVNGHPTIVTGRLSLSDYRSDNRLAQRGVAIHGTNVGFNNQGEIELNEQASAGCFRVASGDVTILLLHYIQRRINQETQNGTPIFTTRPGERRNITVPEPQPPVAEAVTQSPALPQVQPSNPVIETPIPDPTSPNIRPLSQPPIDPDAASVIRL